MPTFQYKAKDGPTNIVTGAVEAGALNEAIAKIAQSGYIPIEVQETSAPAKRGKQKSADVRHAKPARVNLQALSFFTRQLSDLLEAGVPLLKALLVTGRQQHNPALKEIIEDLQQHVKNGGSLPDAMARHPQAFSTLYVNMIRSAEASGKTSEVLSRLAQFMEKDVQMRARVKSSLLYPCLILGVGFLTVFIMLSFVLPRVIVLFEDFNAQLPWPTVMVMKLSVFFAGYWWLCILILLAGGWALQNYFLHTDEGRLKFDRASLKLPLIGAFLVQVEIGRFARTLGTLIDSGVSIVQALRSATDVLSNSVLKKDFQAMVTDVEGGVSLTRALGRSAYIPELAANFISVGEESGRLQMGLFKLADMYERESEETAKSFVSLLGPVVLVFIVMIVGGLIISILLPIFRMNLIFN